jgi:hypothetical protein
MRSGREEEFYWLPLSGDQQVTFQAIEIPPLARLIPPPGFPLIAPAASNSNVIAHREWATVDDVNTLGVKVMAELGQSMKQR